MSEKVLDIVEVSKQLEQDALIDLWEVDLREQGGDIIRFCNHVNERKQPVVWKGQTYTPHPIKLDGFERNVQGEGNRPTLTVANILGVVTGIANQFGQLVGVPTVRRQTYARFLDAVNFTLGNPKADTTQEVVTNFIIERMVSLSSEAATFELAIPAESDGALIPSRVMLADICCWRYRGEECGYTGGPVADRFDVPTNDIKKDACSGSLTGCRARFGATAALPFGGYPSSDKIS